MKSDVILTHEFVEFIPDVLEENRLYISLAYGTAVHRCFCGCGREVVTPLSPTDWHLTFDGRTVSLFPSIGSWNSPCRSHYWIKKNRAHWAPQWTEAQIAAGRRHDAQTKKRYLDAQEDGTPDGVAPPAISSATERSLWDTIKAWFS
jgi:hypothetical protein